MIGVVGRGGGVALFFCNCIKFTLVVVAPEYRDLEVVSAELEFYGNSFRVIGYYRSGGCGSMAIEYMEASVKCFSKLCFTEKKWLFY